MGRRRSAVFIDGEAVKSDCGGRSNVPRAEKRARKAKRRPDSDQTEGRRELGAQERQQGHCSAAEAAEDAEKDARWIGYIFLDDFGRTKPAFLNSTGVMYPSVECILKLLYQCT